MWDEFVVGTCVYPRVFFSQSPLDLFPSEKPTCPNSYLTQIENPDKIELGPMWLILFNVAIEETTFILVYCSLVYINQLDIVTTKIFFLFFADDVKLFDAIESV